MREFGTEPYGDKDGFKVICNKCGKEASIVPISYYEDGNYDKPIKIVLEIRCTCGNKYGSTMDS